MANETSSEQALYLTRIFDAPIDVVFELWTQPRHIIRWFGPRTFSLTHCEVDLQVGGKWRVCMHDGKNEVWVWGIYRAIDPPGRISYSSSMDWMRCETLVDIRLEALDGETTRMQFRQAEFATKDDRDGHIQGWNSSLDKLAEHILRFRGAGLLRPGIFPPDQRNGTEADFAEAAARAEAERKSGVTWPPPED